MSAIQVDLKVESICPKNTHFYFFIIVIIEAALFASCSVTNTKFRVNQSKELCSI